MEFIANLVILPERDAIVKTGSPRELIREIPGKVWTVTTHLGRTAEGKRGSGHTEAGGLLSASIIFRGDFGPGLTKRHAETLRRTRAFLFTPLVLTKPEK